MKSSDDILEIASKRSFTNDELSEIMKEASLSSNPEVLNAILENYWNNEGFDHEAISILASNDEAMKNDSFNKGVGSIFAGKFWRFRDPTEVIEILTQYPSLRKAVPSAISAAETEYFELFQVLSLLSGIPDLMAEQETQDAISKRIDEIATVFENEQPFEEHSLWQAVLAISLIPTVFENDKIKEALLGKADFFAKYIFDVTRGPYDDDVGGWVASCLLAIPYLVTNGAINAGISFRMQKDPLVKSLIANTNLRDMYMTREMIRRNGLDAEEKLTDNEVQTMAETIRQSDIPGVIISEVFNFEDLYQKKEIQKAIEERLGDIAQEIESANTWYDMPPIWPIHDVPAIMKDKRIVNATAQKIETIMDGFRFPSEKEVLRFRGILGGKIKLEKNRQLPVKYERKDERYGTDDDVEWFSHNELTIDLSNRTIIKLDLAQLSKFWNMKKLSLKRNSIRSMDVSPLLHCIRLQEIDTDPTTDLLLDPLYKYVDWPAWVSRMEDSLTWIRYDDLVRSSAAGWVEVENKLILALEKNPKMIFAHQVGLLDGIGLRDLVHYDGNILDAVVGYRGTRAMSQLFAMQRARVDYYEIRNEIVTKIREDLEKRVNEPYNLGIVLFSLKSLGSEALERISKPVLKAFGIQPSVSGADLLKVLDNAPSNLTRSQLTDHIRSSI